MIATAYRNLGDKMLLCSRTVLWHSRVGTKDKVRTKLWARAPLGKGTMIHWRKIQVSANNDNLEFRYE